MNVSNNGASFIPFIDQLKRLGSNPILPDMAEVMPDAMPKDLTQGWSLSNPQMTPGIISKAMPYANAAGGIMEAIGPNGSLTKGNPIPLATSIAGLPGIK